VNPGGLILLYQGGTNSTAVISNVLDQFRFAHLAVHTAPTNDDKLLIWSSLATSNRSTTLSGFMTNPPAAVSLGTNSLLLVHTTNNTGTGIVAQATVLQIREAIAANPGALALTNQINTNQFVSGQYALATELVARTNHGFSAKPTWVRWVLVCTNADNGYVAGEELDLWSFSASAAGQAAFSGGANSNTVFLYCLDTTPDQVHTNGTLTAITALNWNARCYARP
jgi:hypothetical protein